MRNILVTGGAGFIGSHLCRRLVADGNSVVAVDNLSQGSIELIADLQKADNFTFIEADVFDAVKIQSLLKHNQFDMVYQLVAKQACKEVATLLCLTSTRPCLLLLRF